MVSQYQHEIGAAVQQIPGGRGTAEIALGTLLGAKFVRLDEAMEGTAPLEGFCSDVDEDTAIWQPAGSITGELAPELGVAPPRGDVPAPPFGVGLLPSPVQATFGLVS